MTKSQSEQSEQAAFYTRDSARNPDFFEAAEAQLKAIREYAAKNELEPVKEYTDTGESRDQFERMMADATQKNPPFQQILVYDLSRFSRSPQEFQEQRARLEANRVTLRSLM